GRAPPLRRAARARARRAGNGGAPHVLLGGLGSDARPLRRGTREGGSRLGDPRGPRPARHRRGRLLLRRPGRAAGRRARRRRGDRPLGARDARRAGRDGELRRPRDAARRGALPPGALRGGRGRDGDERADGLAGRPPRPGGVARGPGAGLCGSGRAGAGGGAGADGDPAPRGRSRPRPARRRVRRARHDPVRSGSARRLRRGRRALRGEGEPRVGGAGATAQLSPSRAASSGSRRGARAGGTTSVASRGTRASGRSSSGSRRTTGSATSGYGEASYTIASWSRGYVSTRHSTRSARFSRRGSVAYPSSPTTPICHRTSVAAGSGGRRWTTKSVAS